MVVRDLTMHLHVCIYIYIYPSQSTIVALIDFAIGTSKKLTYYPMCTACYSLENNSIVYSYTVYFDKRVR